MKKKLLVLLVTLGCLISLSACAGKKENVTVGDNEDNTVTVSTESESDIQITETNSTDAEETFVESEVYEYPPKDNTSAVWESERGYSMTYNPSVFTLDDTGEADIFIYNTAEKLDAPVYISIQQYTDMDAKVLADGLVLQSGIDGVEAQEAYFGADSLETQNVYVENDIDGVKQIQAFYAIPQGEGSLLVEIGSYVGVSIQIDGIIEAMLGTFSLMD